MGEARLQLMTREGAPAGPPGGIPLDPSFLERYEIGEAIGRGAMAMVLKARERASGEELAVKFLCRPNPDQAKRLKLEGKLLLEIRHPSVIRVFETGEMGGHPYLVMELVTGGTLRDIMTARGRIPFAEAVTMMADVLVGLHACHEHGVVHRDLKPENILIDAAGRPKLADLGIAKSFASTEEITKLGTLLGTPTYMAPEQVRAETVSVATDIYAAGTMLYEMIAGRAPFVADALVALLAMHLSTPAPPITDLVEVPEALATVIHAALAKRIDERPRSADELARRLRKCIAAARPTPKLPGESSRSSLKLAPDRASRSGSLGRADLGDGSSGRLARSDLVEPPSPPPPRDSSSNRIRRGSLSVPAPRPTASAPKSRSRHFAETIGIGLLALAVALLFVLMNNSSSRPRRPAPRAIEAP